MKKILFMTKKTTSIFRILDDLASKAEKEGFSLEYILRQLGDRAFGAFIFFLAIPCCIPFLWLIPQIVSLPLVLLSWQWLIGTQQPWMPKTISRRKIDKENLGKIAKVGYKWLGWVEKISKPRVPGIINHFRQLVGLCMCLFSLAILLPFPGTNTVPGYAMALISFGMIGKDGVLVLLGLLVGWAWTFVLLFAAFFSLNILLDFTQLLLDLMPF